MGFMLFVLIIVFRVEMGLPSAQVLQRFRIASTLVGKHCISLVRRFRDSNNSILSANCLETSFRVPKGLYKFIADYLSFRNETLNPMIFLD